MSGLQKSEMLDIIRRAKSSHIRWRSYAQGLVDGVELGAERAPVRHTDCRFGLWYYGDGSQQLGHLDSFRAIERPHEGLHTIYARIEALVGEGKLPEARAELEALVAASRTLLEQIERLESEVKQLPD